MDIYLVRHGQTDGNVARRHQHADTPLNDVGKEQVKTQAQHLETISATHLISSTNKRALETARIIGQTCGLVPETYPVFEEWKRPDFLVGERLVSMVTLRFAIRWFFGLKDASMHDGESYQDLLRRVAQAKKQLEQLPPHSKVIVVTHSVYMNFFVDCVLRSDTKSIFGAAGRLVRILTTKNAGIILLRCRRNSAGVCQWRKLN